MKNWILAIRPKTLLASISPVILGLGLAYYFTKSINFVVAIFTLLSALFMQIATNLANDYIDYEKGVDNQNRLGPTRVTSSGLISLQKMKLALIASLSLALIFGTYLMMKGGIVIVIMGLCSMYFSYGYSGGPFPLSYLGLGEFAAFIFFGIVAVNGSFFLQTNFFHIDCFYLSLCAGAFSAAILAVNNLRDYSTDLEAKKRTLAVRLGIVFQRRLIFILLILPYPIIIYLALKLKVHGLLFTLIIPLFSTGIFQKVLTGKIDSGLNFILAKISISLFIFSIISGLSFIIYANY